MPPASLLRMRLYWNNYLFDQGGQEIYNGAKDERQSDLESTPMNPIIIDDSGSMTGDASTSYLNTAAIVSESPSHDHYRAGPTWEEYWDSF